ncbi:ester cyclase [Specibacter sp. RAF43]|uniref:ester cyclase n=1 Tax=Specibacter sp. RAF43 TaxID=3233057 RepID=UPI003F98588C
MANDPYGESLATRYSEALGAGRLEEILSFYSPDVIVEDTWESFSYRGVADVREYLAPILTALRPHWIVDQIFATGEGFALSWFVGGFHELDLPGMPATGKPYTCAGASIVAFEGEKITRVRDFWNKHSLLKQLGLLPAPRNEESTHGK